jgi:transglycosylase-like protein
MYVPAPPAPPVVVPAPLASTAPALTAAIGSPLGTALIVRSAGLNVTDGQAATVTGTLRTRAHISAGWAGGPLATLRSAALLGRMVTLQALGRRGWSTIARARTRANGAFRLHFLPRRSGSERVRLHFAGDTYLLGAYRRLGRMNVHLLGAAATRKALCVAELESSTRWHIVDPPYSGGLQFSDSTWLAAGGGRFSSTAAGATPEQQMQVFSEYEPSHPGAWPMTVPACP